MGLTKKYSLFEFILFSNEYIHFLIAAALRQAAQQLVYNATKTSGLHWRLGLAPESKHFCYLLQMQTFGV